MSRALVRNQATVLTAIFREIKFGSDTFHQECELRNEVLRKPIGRSLYEEDLASENTSLHFGLFIAENLVACVIALPVSATEAKIRQMAVSHKNQAQGFGRKILAHLESELAKRGFTDFWLHARISAVGFYQKLGYERVGPEFTEIGIPHVRMQKSLS